MRRLVSLGMLLKFSLLTSCATLNIACDEPPPVIEICVLNGDGTAECALADDTEVTKHPDELVDYIATNREDYVRMQQWCIEQSSDK